MSGRLLWLPNVLRAAGLDVVETAGWRDRGKPTMEPHVVVAHHTGSDTDRDVPYAHWLAEVGRPPAVPPPLAHLYLERAGRYHVLASGRANHAGTGGWRGYTGNSSAIGIEAENTGRQDWPTVQYDAYVAGVAAILRHLGHTADHLCGHKEWATPAGRKWDPGGIDMNAMRADVGALLVPGTQPDTLTTDEVLKLRQLIAAWESVGSNPTFPIYTIGHVRESRNPT